MFIKWTSLRRLGFCTSTNTLELAMGYQYKCTFEWRIHVGSRKIQIYFLKH